ncbi:MAG: hypothetical protein WC819_06380, partial [Parcubacteria group bacterium]
NDVLRLADMLAIDPNKIIVATEEGDVTITGIMTTDTLVAEDVQTKKLTIDDNVTTTDENEEEINAASVGTATIPADKTEITVQTTAITEDSRVFVTVKNAPEVVAAQVRDIEDGQFVIEMDKSVSKDIMVDWFVVGGTQ